MYREVRTGVYSVGAVDWDRRLFDELIPLPDGTTYNAYVVKGADKTTLIDTVDPTKQDVLINNLRDLGVDRIDYIIPQHSEQDHSGAIPKVLAEYPTAKIVTNRKCADMLIDHLHIPEDKFRIVGDGDVIDLGGKTLRFMFTPWVHWPETMVTHLPEERILFTCDLFGSHLATSDLYAVDEARTYTAAKRYYAEIMMPFRGIIRQHLEKLKTIKFDIIATSHGPIYDNPSLILDAYADWTSDRVKNEAVVAYVSMHGSTQRCVERLISALTLKGVTVKPFNLTRTDVGELAMALVDAATLVVATPTVLAGPHPAAAYATYLANALRPKLRYFSFVVSFGWGSKVTEQLSAMAGNLKADMLSPVVVKGLPREEDYAALDRLAEAVAERHLRL